MSDPAALTHVFFDIGGVLGTNGWDREQRARVAAHFSLDADFDHRHHQVVGALESGAMSLDEYLRFTVFLTPQEFSREDFILAMQAESRPFPECIALAGRVRKDLRRMTLNNESEALNLHRIESFGLRAIFEAFLSSCWLRGVKPELDFFRRALAIAQAEPSQSLFVDDREQNLVPARELGMRTILYRNPVQLEGELKANGVL